jgi:hypothetical protein
MMDKAAKMPRGDANEHIALVIEKIIRLGASNNANDMLADDWSRNAVRKPRKDPNEHIASLIEEIMRLKDRKSPVEIIAEVEPKMTGSEKEASWEPEKEGHKETFSFFAHQSYVMISRNYQLFLESLNDPYTSNLPKQTPSYSTDEERKPEPGFEVISYRERVHVARNMHMNALMGGGHNHVPPKDMDAYKFWTMASKFNQLLSFMMYDRAISGG